MGGCCDAGQGGSTRPITAPRISRTRKNRLTIQYFDGAWGRPDPIVQLLEYEGIDYDYLTVSQEEWAVTKAEGAGGEMGCLPIISIDGREKQQTNAVLRSLGMKHGFYDPSDWKQAGVIDMIVETYADVLKACGVILYLTEDP